MRLLLVFLFVLNIIGCGNGVETEQESQETIITKKVEPTPEQKQEKEKEPEPKQEEAKNPEATPEVSPVKPPVQEPPEESKVQAINFGKVQFQSELKIFEKGPMSFVALRWRNPDAYVLALVKRSSGVEKVLLRSKELEVQFNDLEIEPESDIIYFLRTQDSSGKIYDSPPMLVSVPPLRVPDLKTYVVHEFKAFPEPNKFAGRIKWNFSFPTEIDIYRMNSDSAEKVFNSKERNGFWVDPNITGGHSYKYLVNQVSRKTGEVLSQTSFELQVPLDLELKDVMDLNALNLLNVKSYKRVFISQGAILSVFTHNFVLETEELFSDNGTIETLPENFVSPALQNGINAGSVSIKAKKAYGSLTVILRGGKGGIGAKAQTMGDEGRGRKGDPGQNATFKTYTCGGGNGPPPICIDCVTSGTSGGKGQKGQQGYQGGKGMPGGGAGSLLFEVDESQEFKLSVQRLPGTGGEGGLGSEGGIGGEGGDPGSNYHPNSTRVMNQCKITPTKGPQGDPGDLGPRGPNGDIGSQGQVCIRLSANSGLDCR